jgi:hypothetical protein
METDANQEKNYPIGRFERDFDGDHCQEGWQATGNRRKMNCQMKMNVKLYQREANIVIAAGEFCPHCKQDVKALD